MRRALWLSLLSLLWAGIAMAALQFPALTGRVVDDAHLLSANAKQTLEQQLADYENGTGNQVVVVTLPSLQGDAIEDYGYQLGRAWQLGQKGKNNGAILIVAPVERKVRIEVGYGLEPLLTDAASSAIIERVITPQFTAGNMEEGIVRGVGAMLGVLGGNGVHAAAPTASPDTGASGINLFWLLIILFFFFRFATRHPLLAGFFLANQSSWFGGSRSGGDSGGGFSGGGGSFGGGGASGSW